MLFGQCDDKITALDTKHWFWTHVFPFNSNWAGLVCIMNVCFLFFVAIIQFRFVHIFLLSTVCPLSMHWPWIIYRILANLWVNWDLKTTIFKLSNLFTSKRWVFTQLASKGSRYLQSPQSFSALKWHMFRRSIWMCFFFLSFFFLTQKFVSDDDCCY